LGFRVRGFDARLGFAFFSVMALDHASGDLVDLEL
jgi:hypothetical protein